MGTSMDEMSSRLAEVPRRGSTARQYEILMTFMEEHGDLSRPAKKGQSMESRIQQMQLWQELEKKLNSAEPARFSKTLLKWKKVWADLKNNVKRKAAMVRASGGRCSTKLSSYELRVLKVMGMVSTLSVQSLIQQNSGAVRLGAAELPASPAQPWDTSPLGEDSREEVLEEFDTTLDWSQNPNINYDSYKVEYLETGYEEVEVLEELEADEEPLAHTELKYDGADPSPLPKPDSAGHTTTRGARAGRAPRSLRAVERAARAGRRADARWRRFLEEARRRELAQARAALRLRARELRLQAGWQALCSRGLALLERCLTGTAPPQAPGGGDSGDTVTVEVEALSEPEAAEAAEAAETVENVETAETAASP